MPGYRAKRSAITPIRVAKFPASVHSFQASQGAVDIKLLSWAEKRGSHTDSQTTVNVTRVAECGTVAGFLGALGQGDSDLRYLHGARWAGTTVPHRTSENGKLTSGRGVDIHR